MLIIVALAALAASCLTFFSGFGLGTILMPVFLFFCPVDTAIALTALVHFLNNTLKLVLLWKKAKWGIVLTFGLPAFFTAFLGAKLLFALQSVRPLHVYELFGRQMSVMPLKLAVAGLIVFFVVVETLPLFKHVRFSAGLLPLGGALSGFFGGLSGHQGALRSMFLLKCGLSKENYIATGVIIACLVDFSRIFVYGGYLIRSQYQDYRLMMAVAVVSAFAGVFLGRRLLTKITMKTVQIIVSVMLVAIACLLAAGII